MNSGNASDRSARTAKEGYPLSRPLALPTRSLLKPALFCALLLGPAFTGTAASVAGVSFTSTDQGHQDFKSRMTGWQFTVGASPIEVVALGYQDFGVNGLADAHQVGIWRISDQQLVADNVVFAGTVSTLEGHFRYTSLGSPVILTPGTAYIISAFDEGNDTHVWDAAISGFPNMEVTGFAVDPAITIGAPGTAHGPFMSSFGFPGTGTIGDARSALLGPNLKYNVVPEPSPALLALVLSLGVLGSRPLARRSGLS